MTVIVFQDNQKENFKVLQNQPHNVLADFCKLASNFLIKGTNTKLYHAAAQKLQVGVAQIQTVVESMAYLFLEALRNKISKDAFKEVILNLDLSEEFFDCLYEEYLNQKDILESALSQLGVQHHEYRNLEWRFEAQVSSRALTKQIQPKILINFHLDKGGKTEKVCLQSNISNILHMNRLIIQALQDSKTNHSKKIQRAIAN